MITSLASGTYPRRSTRLATAPTLSARGSVVTADELAETLGMQRHPEGGRYVETWRGPDISGRATSALVGLDPFWAADTCGCRFVLQPRTSSAPTASSKAL